MSRYVDYRNTGSVRILQILHLFMRLFEDSTLNFKHSSEIFVSLSPETRHLKEFYPIESCHVLTLTIHLNQNIIKIMGDR
jgi:hypothetical protein